MNVAQMAQKLELATLVEGDMKRDVTGGYVGDLLSWVMGRAKEGDAWITVIGNVNAVAVAVLADTSCIVLAENSPLDEEARTRALAQRVTILSSPQTAYQLAVLLSRILA